MSKLRVAMCGYGPMGRMHAKLMLSQPDVEIVGVADVQDRVRAVAEEDLKVPVWKSAEELLQASGATLSGALCPDCFRADYPAFADRLEQ